MNIALQRRESRTHLARATVDVCIDRDVSGHIATVTFKFSGLWIATQSENGSRMSAGLKSVRANNFRGRVFNPAAERIGILALGPHNLRDSAASLAITSGASIKAVQRMLGHASTKVMLDIYGGLFKEDLEILADTLEERYG